MERLKVKRLNPGHALILDVAADRWYSVQRWQGREVSGQFERWIKRWDIFPLTGEIKTRQHEANAALRVSTLREAKQAILSGRFAHLHER